MKNNPMNFQLIYGVVILAIIIAAGVYLYNHNSSTAPTEPSAESNQQSSLNSSAEPTRNTRQVKRSAAV